MYPLDPFTMPLSGQILIEASAGTGKTYTLVLLVLRLLLEQELSIDQILVVTFTRAATEELRGRIRLRLREALDLLQDGAGSGADPALQRLLEGCTSQEPARKEQQRILLQDALTRMDEAAIHTIHGFCQRMLQEHAFVSGSPFRLDFIEDEGKLRRQIMEDFWRLHFYDHPHQAAWAAANWQTPEGLLKAIGPHLDRDDLICLPHVDTEEIAALEHATARLFGKARSLWQREQQNILTLLAEYKGLSRAKSKKISYHSEKLETGSQALDTWLQSEKPQWIMPEMACLFTAATVRSLLGKRCKEAPSHPFLDLFDQLHDHHARLDRQRRITLLLAARRYLATELARRKEEKNQLFFNDLLNRLAISLTSGQALARTISRRFPAILVDEFQDTDPVQYRIFSTIHAARRDHGLFLIGDPKQAIYGFRGADIFTYLAARRDTRPEHRFTMTTNYRSARIMVEAVNRLFARENPFALASDDIPFIPMQAHADEQDGRLIRADTPQTPLHCLLLDRRGNGNSWSKELATEQAAACCAREIAALLHEGATGRARIGDRPVCGSDIGILVRTHHEGTAMRKALARHHIASVHASQESVFASPEAEQLQILLSCLSKPSDPALLRTLLVTDLFGYTANMLDRLRDREEEWNDLIAEMDEYARVWNEQGVLAMFYQLLGQRKTVRRLLARDNGERILTNFTHLVELLQEASRTHDRNDMLLRWLADRMADPDNAGDAAQIRLESDELLVRIITIHKSKGLEYPLVFLPFPWSARPEEGKPPFTFHDPEQDNRLCLDLGTGDPRHVQLAEQERLAADLRLLYVALTRARHACFFCWGHVSAMEKSAMAYLLHDQPPASPDDIATDLVSLQEEGYLTLVQQEQEDRRGKVLTVESGPHALHTRSFTGTIDDSWRIASYSSLTSGHDPRPEQPDYDRTDSDAPGQQAKNRFGFPRGAAAGTCLHAILERISFTDPGGRRDIIATQLANASIADAWTPVVEAWIADVLATGIMPGFCLEKLHDRDRINELAFSYPLASVDMAALNRVLKRYGHAPLPGHDTQLLRGLLVGFVDLIFRHQGRYCIVDYKSNHLGNQIADYTPARLEEAMRAHRYDLQYLLYTLALHRYLQYRLPEYDYSTHIGPVCYLFLRGMDPQTPESGVFRTLPDPGLIQELDACIRGEAS